MEWSKLPCSGLVKQSANIRPVCMYRERYTVGSLSEDRETADK